MHSFRYHLVTICSVFVALALGLLLGAAIASSELVQQTSDGMVDDVMSRYDALVSENATLEQAVDDNEGLAQSLTGAWAEERLDGRTIVLLLGNSTNDEALKKEYTKLLSQSGASVVNVTVLATDFGTGSEDTLAALQEIVPSEDGKEYPEVLAEALVAEWASVYTGSFSDDLLEDLAITPHDYTAPLSSNSTSTSTTTEVGENGVFDGLSPKTPLQTALYDKYPLTRALLTLEIIKIEADYSPLSGHSSPEASLEQQAIYSIASAWQLPYGVNGLVNGFVPAGVEDENLSRVGIQVAFEMQERGASGSLPYPAWLRTSLPKTDEELTDTASYYVLLIRPTDTDTTMVSVAGTSGLSCVTTPSTIMGRYSSLALLTGSTIGVYGDDREAGYHYAPTPRDSSGRQAFR